MAWVYCIECKRQYNTTKGGCTNPACVVNAGAGGATAGGKTPVAAPVAAPVAVAGAPPSVGVRAPARSAPKPGPAARAAVSRPVTLKKGSVRAGARKARDVLVKDVDAPAAAGTGGIRIVHRADSRDLDHDSIARDRGFACYSGQWCIREKTLSKKFIEKLLDPSLDVSDVAGFEFAAEILTPVQINVGGRGMTQVKLNDVMATIKRVLKDTRAFWVSTSLNKECGGYATKSENFVYQITLPRSLKQYELVLGEGSNTLKPVERRSGDLVPTICFDGEAEDGSDAKIVAINSGPIKDCEISFLTRLDYSWIKCLKLATGS